MQTSISVFWSKVPCNQHNFYFPVNQKKMLDSEIADVLGDFAQPIDTKRNRSSGREVRSWLILAFFFGDSLL